MTRDIIEIVLTVAVCALVPWALVMLFIAVRGPLSAWLVAHETARDRADYERWQRMQELAQNPNNELFKVRRVYQRARTGDKAIVVSLRTDQEQDAWFESMSVRSGGIALVASPSSGWGPHNRNPNVLYVHAGQLLDYLSVPARKAADRHKARLQRQNAR